MITNYLWNGEESCAYPNQQEDQFKISNLVNKIAKLHKNPTKEESNMQ